MQLTALFTMPLRATKMLAMKHMAILLVVCLQVSAGASSQTVTYSAKNARLETIFNAIKQQTGYVFFYKANVLKDAKVVNLDVKNASITQVLELCLSNQGLSYTIEDKTIVIAPKEEKKATATNTLEQNEAPAVIDVKGVVKDEEGKPAVGVSIKVKGTNNGTTSNTNGEFTLTGVDPNATLVFSSVNLETFETKVNGRNEISLIMKAKVSQLEDVAVTVNTGYQQLSKERLTGAITQVNSEQLNRRVTGSILDRIADLVPGLTTSSSSSLTGDNSSGINIRGIASLGYTNTNPLIILDNFPFDGDLSRINPNDVATVDVLKDAAAASIWGARASNGVIVITTKKGGFNQRTRVDFNTNFTVANKPNLYYDQRVMPSSAYIEVQKYLYDRGYYQADLSNTFTFPVIPPAVEIFDALNKGTITSTQAQLQLNALTAFDIREDFNKYLLRTESRQQYALNIRGGAPNQRYYVGLGYDDIKSAQVRNGSNRFSLLSTYTFMPVKGLELSGSIYFIQGQVDNSNPLSKLGSIQGVAPYFKLRDESGNNLPVSIGYREKFKDSLETLGFMNWDYRPLNEAYASTDVQKNRNMVLSGGINYRFLKYFNADFKYQREYQWINIRRLKSLDAYQVRNNINLFSQYNSTAKTFTYIFPKGSTLELGNSEMVSNNYRGSINMNITKGEHALTGTMGGELRENVTESFTRNSIGYNDEYGSASSAIDYQTFFTTITGATMQLPSPASNLTGNTYRYISYYTNLGYTYRSRYTVSLTGRRDGANLFGVKTNDKITPFWSLGLAWNLSKEEFYKSKLFPYLNFRLSTGTNGNVYNGSAYLTAQFLFNNSSGLPFGTINNAPNPSLRWEKVTNYNLGIDFSMKNNILSGSLEFWKRKANDLVDDIPTASSTGFSVYTGNGSSMNLSGFDMRLISNNIRGTIGWTTSLIMSHLSDKITKVSSPNTGRQIAQGYRYNLNKPLAGLYAYKWAGLDPSTGDPLGVQGGLPSKDYAAILNSATIDSLVYVGNRRPRFSGSLINSVNYKGFALSINITYKLGYVFRKPTVVLNYQNLLNGGQHSDYLNRWQKPGDEKTTNIPSLTYLTNDLRNEFYQYSEINYRKGDHLRLQDINISYDLLSGSKRIRGLNSFQVYAYLNNLGILWSANKDGIDPDVITADAWPSPRSYSLGLRIGF